MAVTFFNKKFWNFVSSLAAHRHGLLLKIECVGSLVNEIQVIKISSALRRVFILCTRTSVPVHSTKQKGGNFALCKLASRVTVRVIAVSSSVCFYSCIKQLSHTKQCLEWLSLMNKIMIGQYILVVIIVSDAIYPRVRGFVWHSSEARCQVTSLP